MTVLYILIFQIIGLCLYVFIFRKWYNGWGATSAEITMQMPEDTMIPNPFINMTHAIEIRASPENVFEWLIQMGQGRGGYYSYDWLERFFGFGIYNVYEIKPELQTLKQGDHIKLHKNGMGATVLAFEENKKLVLGMDSRDLVPGRKYFTPVPRHMYIAGFWSFTCLEQPDGTTRLVERWKIEWTASNPVLNLGLTFGFELPSFIMEQRMLRVIKMLCEGTLPDQLPLV